jgi:hypothetical protein
VKCLDAMNTALLQAAQTVELRELMAAQAEVRGDSQAAVHNLAEAKRALRNLRAGQELVKAATPMLELAEEWGIPVDTLWEVATRE